MLTLYTKKGDSRRSPIHFIVCDNGGVYVSSLRCSWDKKISDIIIKKRIELNKKKEVLLEQGFEDNYSLKNTIESEMTNLLRSEGLEYVQYLTMTECTIINCNCSKEVKEKNEHYKNNNDVYYGGMKDLGVTYVTLKETAEVCIEDNNIKIEFRRKRVKLKNNLPVVDNQLKYILYVDFKLHNIKVLKETPSGIIKELKTLGEFNRYIGKSNLNLKFKGIEIFKNDRVLDLYNKTGFREYYTNTYIKNSNITLDSDLRDLKEGNNNLSSRFLKHLLKYITYFNSNKLIESILKSGNLLYGLDCIKTDKTLMGSFKEELPMKKSTLKFLNRIFKIEGDFGGQEIVVYYKMFNNLEKIGGCLTEEMLNFIEFDLMRDIYGAFNNIENLLNLIKDYGYDNTDLIEYLNRVDQFQGIEKREALSVLMDYNRMGKDMEIVYDKKPSSLKRNHDLLMREYNFMLNQINIQKYNKLKSKLKKYEYENTEFAVKVPDALELIIEEGKVLKHCVGSYANNVVQGKTVILFLRNKKDINIPYFTIEIRNGRLVQCLGKSNKKIDSPLLSKFVEDYKKKIS